MEKNLYGHLVDLDRILWSEISKEDQRRELDHFLYSVEDIIRNQRVLALDETRRMFHAAQSLIDAGHLAHLTRAIVIEGLTLRRLTKNPLVKKVQFLSLSEILSDNLHYMDQAPPDKWSVMAYIESGKAFERVAVHSDRERNLKRAGRAYSRAMRLCRRSGDKQTASSLKERMDILRVKVGSRN